MSRTLFSNGTVWTGTGTTSNALSMRNGRIEALGAAALAGTHDDRVDLRGGMLLPAFGDGHCHPDHAGFEATGPQVRGLSTVEEIVEEVRRHAAAHPGDGWIIGGGYDATIVLDGLFDARWLDEAVPDRPVALRAWDYHTLWCNSEAMRRAGLDASTPDTPRGRFARRPDGAPLGTMIEWDAVDAVLVAAPARTTEDLVTALAAATEAYAAAGVTWIQDAWVEHGTVEAYLEAARRGLLATRVNLAFRADPVRWREQLAEFAADRARVRALGHDRLTAATVTANTVKFFVDGILENRTASLLAPYSDDPCTRGMPVWPYGELLEALTAVDAMGLQAHLHAIGDAGIRTALDAIEHVTRVNGPRDRRPVIAHVQVLAEEDLPRFARLGVIANLQPLWARTDPPMTKLTFPRIGPERARRQYLIGSLLRAGVQVSFGSDWPVSDHRPLAGLPVAVTRENAEREPPGGWLPEECIGIEEALSAYGAGVAHQAFAEDERGTLVPGKVADLVWLDGDVRRLDPHDIAETTTVLGTWAAGVRTFPPANRSGV
ncbi:amidohydrolase [Microbispora sp. NBRC 16548]|uniref:amidohydrolase n=1 Tax=Microbispora sp. NBRC 16548 TaxID=3030994 RepID=UPI0024A2040B|nr:amidohydrolase [Microbispora sp. NBRC 16548]GLX07636.1 amidohydrolase [Microbispora sp. NBRC 16548]